MSQSLLVLLSLLLSILLVCSVVGRVVSVLADHDTLCPCCCQPGVSRHLTTAFIVPAQFWPGTGHALLFGATTTGAGLRMGMHATVTVIVSSVQATVYFCHMVACRNPLVAALL